MSPALLCWQVLSAGPPGLTVLILVWVWILLRVWILLWVIRFGIGRMRVWTVWLSWAGWRPGWRL